MGYRLHYAEKYDVNLAGGSFKNDRDRFERMLSEHMPDSYANVNEDGHEYELVPEELRAYIRELSSLDLEAIHEQWLTAPTDEELRNKNVLQMLTQIYAGYDKDNDFIHVEWF